MEVLSGLLHYLISVCWALCCIVKLIVNSGMDVSSGICFKRCGTGVDLYPICVESVSVCGEAVSKVCRTRIKMGCSLRTRYRRLKKIGLKQATFMGSKFTGALVTSA